jgi:hypothetical protein
MWEGRPLDSLVIGGVGEEDRFTYSLVALLRDPTALSSFLHDCCHLTVTSSWADIDTQITIQGGRADIQIRGPGLYVLIEVKVTAGLHGFQMSTYAKDVARQPDGHLFLLAPRGYLAALMAQATEELEREVPTARLEGISWAAVSDLCVRLSLRSDLDRRLSMYLGDFARVVQERIEAQPPPFSPEQLFLLKQQDLPDIFERLRWVAEQMIKLLSDRLGTSSVGAWGMGLGFYGRNFMVSGHKFWVGYHCDPWNKWGVSPFWVQSPVPVDRWDSHAAQEGWPLHRRRIPTETLVPLPIATDVGEMPELIARLADRAEKYLRTMGELLESEGVPKDVAPIASDIAATVELPVEAL